jgi:HEAT repeat protein
MRSRENGEALVALLPLLVHPDIDRALAARLAAEKLLEQTLPQDLDWLEKEVRSRSRRDVYYVDASAGPVRWRRLTKAALIELSAQAGGDTLLKVASFHDNGYVREAAVSLLDLYTDGSELPFLLLRVNDWVKAVQRAGQTAVERRLVAGYAPRFFDNIYLCGQMEKQRRNDLSGLYGRVRALLCSDAAAAAREAASRSADRHVRRAAFALSVQASQAELTGLRQVILQALSSPDLWLRICAARTARARLYGAELREVLGQARGDRSVPVRREALLGFIDEHPELCRSLLDPCASLREMVRFYLRKQANLDFAAVYRNELERLAAAAPTPGLGARLATALAGLGETGKPSDAELVELHTIDERPRVRQAALRALHRLDGGRRLATLAAALGDAHPGVFRTALLALGPELPLLGEHFLLRAFTEQPDPNCRRQLLPAMTHLPADARLRCLRQALSDPDSEVSVLARRLLHSDGG